MKKRQSPVNYERVGHLLNLMQSKGPLLPQRQAGGIKREEEEPLSTQWNAQLSPLKGMAS